MDTKSHFARRCGSAVSKGEHGMRHNIHGDVWGGCQPPPPIPTTIGPRPVKPKWTIPLMHMDKSVAPHYESFPSQTDKACSSRKYLQLLDKPHKRCHIEHSIRDISIRPSRHRHSFPANNASAKASHPQKVNRLISHPSRFVSSCPRRLKNDAEKVAFSLVWNCILWLGFFRLFCLLRLAYRL